MSVYLITGAVVVIAIVAGLAKHWIVNQLIR